MAGASRILFVNVPFVKRDEAGRVRTGPGAGSRWPWTNEGYSEYACFPFFMAYAVQYLRLHGIEADYYDAVASRHWDYELVKRKIAARKPDLLFFETATPLHRSVMELARWAKEQLGARIVLTGPHVHTFAEELIAQPFVDHCIVGEYERPALEIARDPERAERIYRFVHLDDVDRVNGENFVPARKMRDLFNYWDPAILTARPQLQVATSRGCPFRCTYCQWPKVMNDRRYRVRSPELVIDEIRSVIAQYEAAMGTPAGLVGACCEEAAVLARRFQGRVRATERLRARLVPRIASVFFDDDTWNVGVPRVRALCRGLKEIGLPWSMMGRIDTTPVELYDLMVESGCVGFRFGVESFSQRLLDNTNKRLDARVSHDTIVALLQRFSGLQFHFTTMRGLPGETPHDAEHDRQMLAELKAIGERSGNEVDWQVSDCVAFPGTDLWEEMVARGMGEELRDFDLYDGSPSANRKLVQVAGWLGEDYRPREDAGQDLEPGQSEG